jgi:hypothetical protein
LHIGFELEKKKNIDQVMGITHFKISDEEEETIPRKEKQEIQNVVEETIASTFGLESTDIEVTVIWFLF